MKLSDLPALGQALNAGIFIGITTKTDGTHCAAELLLDKPEGELNWDDAMAWAKAIDAELMTRPVAAMAYANAPDQFEQEWHWLADAEKAGRGCAWLQTFTIGLQLNYLKSYEGRARAVRRFQPVPLAGPGLPRLPPNEAQQRECTGFRGQA